MEISAEKFKRARMALGLQQQQFAALVGKTRQTISEYENGKEPVGVETYLLAVAWAGNEAAMRARMREVGLLDDERGE